MRLQDVKVGRFQKAAKRAGCVGHHWRGSAPNYDMLLCREMVCECGAVISEDALMECSGSIDQLALLLSRIGPCQVAAVRKRLVGAIEPDPNTPPAYPNYRCV